MRPWMLAGAAAGLAAAVWSPPVRRWYLTWGATPQEAAQALPGDGLLPDARLISTRAVSIDAAPDRVWPWLVQMGSGRGGAYTYDWIENLFGLGMHSADRILPEFQHLAVGDVLPLGAGGPGMRVEICDTGRTLVFRSEDEQWVWIFVLRPEAGGTRLISRNRISDAGAPPMRRLANRFVMEPGSLIMERKMLLGIRDRAESAGLPAPVAAAERDAGADARRRPAAGTSGRRGVGPDVPACRRGRHPAAEPPHS